MDRHGELTQLFESSKYDNSCAILIYVEDQELKWRPFGGQFRREGSFYGEEAYEMLTYLLNQAEGFNGNVKKEHIV